MDWPILAQLPAEERRRLLAACRRRTFARNEVVFHEGDLADSFHLLASGRACVRVSTSAGDIATLTVVGPGATFGEVALVLEPSTRSATVIALERCETLSLTSAEFARLREQHPEIDRFLLRVLAEQVRRLTSHLLEALYLPADKRVLRRLADLVEVYGGDGRRVTVPFTQDVLATMAGTSRVTANQALQGAQLAGCITLGRGRIEVLDPGLLARLAS